MEYQGAYQIIPCLWISNRGVANNYNFNKEKNIDCVINCIKDLGFVESEYEYGRSEILEKINSYLYEVTEFMNKRILEFKNILVYCKTGRDTSYLVVLAYLIKYGKIPFKSLVNLIETKIPKCRTFDNMLLQIAIEEFEKQIFKKNYQS